MTSLEGVQSSASHLSRVLNSRLVLLPWSIVPVIRFRKNFFAGTGRAYLSLLFISMMISMYFFRGFHSVDSFSFLL